MGRTLHHAAPPAAVSQPGGGMVGFMSTVELSDGILHEVTAEIRKALSVDREKVEKWNSLTPIQRNEWICWVTIPKKQETRDAHVERMLEELGEGKRTPCCWPGCPHRNPKTAKYFK